MSSFYIQLLAHFFLLSDFHACFALLADPGGDFPDGGLDGDKREADPDEM